MPTPSSLKKHFQTLAAMLARRPKYQIVIASMVMGVLLGLWDYSLGTEISLGALYAVPVVMTAWFVGPRSAFVVGIVSVVSWTAADLAGGVHYSRAWIHYANGAYRQIFYCFLILILTQLHKLQNNLEALAESRAKALAWEAARNVWLQREVLEVGEREQRRIGQDLHDGLCQHLTGTALASQVLAERLPANGAARADANRLVALIENGITQARGIAKGLYPIEMQSNGLMHALEIFTASTSEMFGIQCRFTCHLPVLIENPTIAAHLYRIAQEAVSNAARHGHASEVEVALEESEAGIRLRVCDNGAGMPDPLPADDGMGLRIMTDRARSIGGRIFLQPGITGGVDVTCLVPPRWDGLNRMKREEMEHA